ncbi:MAG: VanW family protein, partial [Chloroflexota bacterium]
TEASGATPLTNGPAVATATSIPTATATRAATPTATETPRPTATPTLTPAPTTIPYDAKRLTDLLGESITSYAGSIPSRVTNVRLATRLIDGATIAPGAVFSFDDRVGAQTIAAGFDVAWGIVSRDGQPVTVPSVAGGICQVATTLFQSVYWAGLPIVERHYHLYWIAHYGEPPYGQVGLDATVDFPPVDFRFRNSTPNWLRIVGTYDSTHVRFRIYGVSQGWKVTSSPTKISRLIKTDRTIIRRDDPTKPAGYQLMIEAAEDGFDATIERLVTKDGGVVDRYDFTNHYDPAQNVLLVGTKGATPTATPTRATPSSTGTPGAVPTATSGPPGTALAKTSLTPGPIAGTPTRR